MNNVVEIKFKLKDIIVKQKILDQNNKVYGFLLDRATGELIQEYITPEPDMLLVPQTEEFWLEVPIPAREFDDVFEFDTVEFKLKNEEHIRCKVENYSIIIPISGRGVNEYISIVFPDHE